MQTLLAEQGIIDMLVKVLELIYYKTVPFDHRVRAQKGEIEKTGMLNEDEYPTQSIARSHLDKISKFILRILLILVKMNQQNCERLTKYNEVIYTQMFRFQYASAKVFKEMYKRAQYIYGDKSSVFTHEEGLDVKATAAAGTLGDKEGGAHLQANLENHLQNWINKLESVRYVKGLGGGHLQNNYGGPFNSIEEGENISS
jgi:hypothetical protein